MNEYFANGILVHNCETCLSNAAEWNPLVIPKLNLNRAQLDTLLARLAHHEHAADIMTMAGG